MFYPYGNDTDDYFPQNCSLILDGNRGQYLPKAFVDSWPQENCSDWAWQTVSKGPHYEEVRKDLSWAERFFNSWRDYLRYGEWDWECPDNMNDYVVNEHYWDAWTDIVDNWSSEQVSGTRTITYTLYQQDDLFMVED